MDDIRYRAIISHAYNPSERQNRYRRSSSIIDRAEERARRYRSFSDGNRLIPTKNPYGNYKSKYYDPVARHERYMRERESLGIGKKLSISPVGSGKGSGRGSGGSRKSSGGSRKSSVGSRKNSANSFKIAEAVKKLREESSLETDAQKEAARRKIEDIQKRLSDRIKQLTEEFNESYENETNLTEIRGMTKSLKDQIESLKSASNEEISRVSSELSNWISNEQDALEKRLSVLYQSQGKTYKPRLKADKQSASDARNKEIKSRADSIYKKQS